MAHQPLWQAQPFREARPVWCRDHPSLSEALLGLDETTLLHLGADPLALVDWLGDFLPGMAELNALCDVGMLPQYASREPDAHFPSHVPGRKWQQITAFAATLPKARAPLLEWCGGKGHLGRLLRWQHGCPVLTLERDPSLCEQGQQLARRSRVEQEFTALDVLTDAAAPVLAGRHAVALHACGELHRHLLREAVKKRLPALDLAPCCYHHLLRGDYPPMSSAAVLRLRRDDVRLAVTGAATAASRELRLRDREMAWKLAYLLFLQRQGMGYRPLRPVDKHWLGLDFAGFCQQLAEREGDALPTDMDWDELEAAGWRRQAETMRLSLLRQGFARALELWLVLDMVVYLQQHGYQVRLGSFCARDVTPRNLLISARLI